MTILSSMRRFALWALHHNQPQFIPPLCNALFIRRRNDLLALVPHPQILPTLTFAAKHQDYGENAKQQKQPPAYPQPCSRCRR